MPVVYGAVGAPDYATGTPVAPYPTGGTAGKKYGYLLFVATKPDSTPADTPTGWTLLGAFAGGAGTQGIDRGPMRIGVFYRESTTVLTGTVSVTVPSNNVTAVWIERWEIETTEAFDWAITGGADTAVGTAWSAVTSAVATDFLKTGDGLSIVSVIPTDTNPTWGTSTLTAQGGGTIALGTVTQRALLASSSGQDIGGRHITAMPTVSAQQLAGTLTYAATLSGTTTNTAGPTAVVRVRAVAPPSGTPAAPTVAAGTGPVEQILVTAPATLPAGATGFHVYRGTNPVSQTDLAPGATWTNTGSVVTLDPGGSYTYQVAAYNVAGEGPKSAASAAVSPNPGRVNYTLAEGNAKVTLSIEGRDYDSAFRVYRDGVLVHTSTVQTGGGGGVLPTYVWEDTGLTNGTLYSYKVTAVAGGKESPTWLTKAATPSLQPVTLTPTFDIYDSGITASGPTALPSPDLWENVNETGARDGDYLLNNTGVGEAIFRLSDYAEGDAAAIKIQAGLPYQMNAFESVILTLQHDDGAGDITTVFSVQITINSTESVNGIDFEWTVGTSAVENTFNPLVGSGFFRLRVELYPDMQEFAWAGLDYARVVVTPSGQTGPKNLSRTGSDAAPASDAATRQGVFARVGSDTALATDAATRTRVLVRSGSDSAPASDTAVRTRVAARTGTDTAPASDAATRTRLLARTSTDTAPAVDAATRSRALARAGTDVAPAADAAVRDKTLVRTAADSAPATDAATRAALALARAADDAGPATDLAVRTLALSRTGREMLSALSRWFDDFDRASLGADWTTHSPSTAGITDNQFAPQATTSAPTIRRATETGSPDQFVEATYRGNGGQTWALAARMPALGTGNGNTGDFYLFGPNGAASAVYIRRKDNLATSVTQVGTAVNMAVASGDVFRLECAGDELIGYVNEVEVIRRSASLAPLTTGGLGVGFYASAVTALRMDNWSGGELDPATDAAVRTKTLTRSGTDTAPVSGDAATRTTTVIRTGSDTAPVSDAASRALALARAGADTVGGSDAAVRTKALTRTSTDAAPAADTATRQGIFARAVGDAGMAVADLASRVVDLFRTASDSAPASDLNQAASEHWRTASDAAPAADSAVGQVTPGVQFVARTGSDTAPATDAATRTGLFARTGSDSAPATDAALTGSVTTRSASDTAPASDVASRALARFRAVTDLAPAIDAARRVLGLARIGTDTAPVTDAATGSTARTVTASDTAPATDAATRQGVFARAVADAAPVVADAASLAGTTISRSSADVLPAPADTATRSLRSSASAADAAPATDAASRAVGSHRASTDAAPAYDAARRAVVISRFVSDSAPATDAARQNTGLTVFAADSAPAADAASQAAIRSRAGSDEAPASDAAERTVLVVRATWDLAPAYDAAVANKGIARYGYEVLVTGDDASAVILGADVWRPPVVVQITTSTTRLSAVPGADVATLRFTFDQPVPAWTVRVGGTDALTGRQVAGYEGPVVTEGEAVVESADLARGDNRVSVYARSARDDQWSRPVRSG